MENAKSSDRPILEDQIQNSENISTKILAPKVITNSSNKVAVKRDLPAGGVDKEIKKGNLFHPLYPLIYFFISWINSKPINLILKVKLKRL
ncbi:hypothetical protein V8V91_13760 [Algoriphagus halophilus]|uniref:hypothetical protein n=1 Tax=Algoriphagus halophilus TaxID=226505 RepID=UPI00358E0526